MKKPAGKKRELDYDKDAFEEYGEEQNDGAPLSPKRKSLIEIVKGTDLNLASSG